jgi:DNA-directed RNA polymerase I subunit RPA43
MRLEGEIKLSTPSHISLLVHGIFNASITSAHLPSNTAPTSSHKDTIYKWHEFEAIDDNVKMEELDDTTGEAINGVQDDVGEKSTGYWEVEGTGERLGGKDGKVVFTVVG